MKGLIIAGITLSFLMLIIFSCSNQDMVGNGTRIGNPTIAGVLYQPDGKTPASNAVVYLRSKDALSSISEILQNRTDDTAAVTTDAQGRFAIDSVDRGTYVIECTDGDGNYALYDSVTVKSMDTSVNLGADTLKPAGVIKGVVKLPQGGDASNVYLLAFGIDRFTTVNTNGSFKLSNLAEGSYDLRLVSGLKNYGVLDTTGISVVSGDTTDLDTIVLPYIGVPVVTDLSVVYDTLKEKITVSWDKINPALIDGYNIYRNASKVNNVPLADTFYVDSGLSVDQSYAYRISVANKDSTEGPKCAEVSTVTASVFPVDTIFNNIDVTCPDGKRTNQSFMVFNKNNGLFYCTGKRLSTQPYYSTKINVYDTNFNFISNLASVEYPYELATDGSGRIYVSDMDSDLGIIKNIVVFNTNNNLEKVIPVYSEDSLGNPRGIGKKTLLFAVDSKGNLRFTSKRQDTLFICDTAGSIEKTLGGFWNDSTANGQISCLATDNSDNIVINQFEIGIKKFDTAGTLMLQTNFDDDWTFSYMDQYSKSIKEAHALGMVIGFDSQTGRMFVTEYSGHIYILNNSFEIIANPSVSNVFGNSFPCFTGNIIVNGKDIYISGDNKVIKMKNNLP